GGSGWIGSASVDQLLADGHTVTALARSDASAAALEAKGATVVRGDLDDLDVRRRGAGAAEAVLPRAHQHALANPAATNAAERAAVQPLGDALAGSGRPFLVAAGIAGVVQGRPATEADAAPFHGPDSPRGGSENLALELVEKDVHAVALRFAPSVHGRRDHGFMAVLHDVARRTGVAAYPGAGTNAWAAVHRSDAARLVSLALSNAPAGARVHGPPGSWRCCTRSHAAPAPPPPRATAPTPGPPCTGPTPPGSSRSRCPRRPPGPGCTRPRRSACRPATSPRRSAARSACLWHPSRP